MSDEYLQVHIEDPSIEFEVIAEVEVELDEYEASATGENRNLTLSRGGEDILFPEDNDAPFAIQGNREHKLSRTLVRETKVGIAYYLHALETHTVPESVAYEQMNELTDMSPYVEWMDELTPRDRRLRLVDLLEWRVDDGGDWAAGKYLYDEPEVRFRTTDLSESAESLAEDIARQIDVKPRMCYWTAQHAALLHRKNHRVEYVEGIALPKHGAQAIRHAWIEIDGDVAELTWPWHWYDGQEAVYYGVTYDKEEVVEARERRNTNGAIALSDEEVLEIGQQMSPDGKIHPAIGDE